MEAMEAIESKEIQPVGFYFSEEDSERADCIISAYESLKEKRLQMQDSEDMDNAKKEDFEKSDETKKSDESQNKKESETEMIDECRLPVPIRVILIGKNTFKDESVLQAIRDGIAEKCAFLAVWLDNAKDFSDSKKEQSGKNPFELFWFEFTSGNIVSGEGETKIPGKFRKLVSTRVIKDRLSDYIPMYDTVNDDGLKNIDEWVEKEIKRMTDFFAECDKIKTEEHTGAIKLSSKGGLGGMFMYAFLERNNNIEN